MADRGTCTLGTYLFVFGMTADQANNGMLRAAILDHSPKCCCHRIAVSFRKALNRIPVQIHIPSFLRKTILQEEKLRGSMIRLGLHLGVTCRIESELIIPKQKLLMPRNYAVTDLMTFGPSL